MQIRCEAVKRQFWRKHLIHLYKPQTSIPTAKMKPKNIYFQLKQTYHSSKQQNVSLFLMMLYYWTWIINFMSQADWFAKYVHKYTGDKWSTFNHCETRHLILNMAKMFTFFHIHSMDTCSDVLLSMSGVCSQIQRELINSSDTSSSIFSTPLPLRVKILLWISELDVNGGQKLLYLTILHPHCTLLVPLLIQ